MSSSIDDYAPQIITLPRCTSLSREEKIIDVIQNAQSGLEGNPDAGKPTERRGGVLQREKAAMHSQEAVMSNIQNDEAHFSCI